MEKSETGALTRCQLVVDVGRILFIDTVEVVPTHKAMIPIFAAGLHDEYELTTDEGTCRLRTWIAPPNLVRSVDGFGRPLAVMAIDPVIAPAVVQDSDRCLAALNVLASGFNRAAWAELLQGIGLVETAGTQAAPLLEAMRLVRESSEENIPSGEIARAVGYSLPHLQHLFRTKVGTSIRSYRTWSRFVSLAIAYENRRSLTDAALSAGFFDSAHLNHAFTDSFGVPPSLVFNDEVEIHVIKAER